MRFSAGSPLALTMLLLLGAAPALQAQSSPAPASAAGIYSCIDDQGRRITADRPIAGCSAKEQRILNRDGSLKTVYPPTLTVDERAEKEAAERKAAEARAAQADAVRRDRNLLARYPNEAPHRKAREAALDTVRVAIKASEKRLQALEAERKPLEPIENIKARADIVEIIGRCTELRKHRDGELWAKCPLHTDRTPSFKVSPKRQSFKCSSIHSWCIELIIIFIISCLTAQVW